MQSQQVPSFDVLGTKIPQNGEIAAWLLLNLRDLFKGRGPIFVWKIEQKRDLKGDVGLEMLLFYKSCKV